VTGLARALSAVPPRVAVHVVLAALPLLAITAHVGGLIPMHVSAGLIVIPTALVLLVLGIFVPMPEDKLVLAGIRWGILATAVYDAVRLDTVGLLGWWADFIPTMGTWLLDIDPSQHVLGGIAGYIWRYAGDGGGLGVVFFVGAAATGLRRLGPTVTVAAAVLFAVGPTWGGLMVTVLLPRGQQLMFPLTPTTVSLSLLGHVVFGIVLGLGCLRCRDLEVHWAGPRVVDLEKLAHWGELPDPVPVPALADIPAASLPGGLRRRALPGVAAPGVAAPAQIGPTQIGPSRLGPARLPAPRASGSGPIPVGARDAARGPWLRPPDTPWPPRRPALEEGVTVVDATAVDGWAPVPDDPGPGSGPTRLPWGARPSATPGRTHGHPALETADFGIGTARPRS
jgi:hypothetical protein